MKKSYSINENIYKGHSFKMATIRGYHFLKKGQKVSTGLKVSSGLDTFLIVNFTPCLPNDTSEGLKTQVGNPIGSLLNYAQPHFQLSAVNFTEEPNLNIS